MVPANYPATTEPHGLERDHRSGRERSGLRANDQHRTGSVAHNALRHAAERRTPLRPWLAMTMRSAGHSFAVWTIVSAAAPPWTNLSVVDGSPSRSRNPASNALLSRWT